MAYIPKPKPCFLDMMEKYIIIDGRQTYRNPAKDRYFQWDELHGEIEVYDKRGRHLGVIDAVNGTQIKEPERGRRINV